MSEVVALRPTPTIKNELQSALGDKAETYWDILNQYLCGRISRVEYDEQIREVVTAQLLHLHNAFIISVIGSSSSRLPPTPPPDAPGKVKAPRKRRHFLPYQGVDSPDNGTLRSNRIKKWTLSMGKNERERIRALDASSAVTVNGTGVPPSSIRRKPREELDEIARERGVRLLEEGKNPPGTYLPVHLASLTRAPTLPHISERISLISAQHNLGPPDKGVSSLLMLACEAKLKQLITQALSLSSTSHAISSIQVTGTASRAQPLSTTSFDTLFTIRPAMLPNQSAAAMRVALGENDGFDHEVHFKERHIEDPRWQILAMLADRSTVREALMSSR